MKTYVDCIPCFARQALYAARLVDDDESVHERVVRRVVKHLGDLEFDRTPPFMAREIHAIIREETGCADPYAAVKDHSRTAARVHVDEARSAIERAADPFAAAVRFAIAGNVLDFARAAAWDDDYVSQALSGAADHELARDDIDRLKSDTDVAAMVLYLADNAGECVFDALLLEQLPAGRVRYAVKGGPVIDDATRDDAAAAGIDALATVVDNGFDAPGTILDECSDRFRDLFRTADVVISKGQANYETLSRCGREVFFLTQAKCPVIARDIGARVGDWLCALGGT